jgi:hypothetical protein
VRNHWVRAAIVHPLLMSAATIATGNRYLLDCLVGGAIGEFALAAVAMPSEAREPARAPVGSRAAPGVAGRHG